MSRLPLIFTLIAAVFVQSCASEPFRDQRPSEKISRDAFVAYRLKLSETFEKSNPPLKLAENDQNYLWTLTREIMDRSDELSHSALTVNVFAGSGGVYKNIAIPGVSLFLSEATILAAESESELAADISVELARVIKRQPLGVVGKRLGFDPDNYDSVLEFQYQLPKNWLIEFDFLSEEYRFSERETLEAFSSAVDLMFGAGYDPRGLIALLKTAEKKKEQFAAYSQYGDKLENVVWDRIARRAPLLNPVIQTSGFINFKARVAKK